MRFGRPNGQQTLAEIVKINGVTVVVRTLEVRGVQKTYPIGTEWKVTMVDDGVRGALKASQQPSRPEQAVLNDIVSVYFWLSPENLTCDGELSRTAVRRRKTMFNAQLRELFHELGREVTEDEAYEGRQKEPQS